MNKPVRALSALGAVALAVGGLVACGSGISSDAVAQVGSTTITKKAFDHWLAIAASSTTASAASITTKAPAPLPPNYTACVAYLKSTEPKGKTASAAAMKSKCAKQYKADKQATLSFLISSQWILGEAAELGVSVSHKEVEQQIASVKKQDYPTEADFKTYLQRTGYTPADLSLKTKIELLTPKMEKKVVTRAEKSITRPVIASYYNKHKSKYQRTEEKGALILLTPTEAQASAAKAEIQSGKSFASVAKGVSILHTSQQGGVYLTTERGREEKGLESALFAAKQGVLTGPVKTDSGYYVFEVKKATPPGLEPLTKVGESIGTTLAAEKVKTELAHVSAAYQKKWKAKTSCRPGYVITFCKESKS